MADLAGGEAFGVEQIQMAVGRIASAASRKAASLARLYSMSLETAS
jgi:hypothetical protein